MTTLNEYKKQYQENGFVIVKNLIPKEKVEYFRNSLEKFIAYNLHAKNLKVNNILNEGMIELNKSHSTRAQIYENNRETDAVAQMIYDENVVGVVKTLLGLDNDSFIHALHHLCRIDAPEDERFTYDWHQQSYYSIFEADQVQLWAPMIQRSEIEMGTMSVLLNSHKKELPHYMLKKPGGIFLIIPENAVRHLEEKFIVIDPGDVIFFHPYLVHRSNQNRSNNVRYTLLADYINPYDPRFKAANRSTNKQYHWARTANYRVFSWKERINYVKQKILKWI